MGVKMLPSAYIFVRARWVRAAGCPGSRLHRLCLRSSEKEVDHCGTLSYVQQSLKLVSSQLPQVWHPTRLKSTVGGILVASRKRFMKRIAPAIKYLLAMSGS